MASSVVVEETMVQTKKQFQFVIVDIDGTVADVRHRLHYIEGPGRKNWKAFFEAMDRDTPIPNVIEYVRKLAENYKILIVTGRPEVYRARTEKWLRQHNVPFQRVYMRRSGDHRPDYVAKADVLKAVSAEAVVLAIDDRPPVCEMYRRIGIKCLKVASDVENQAVNEVYRERSGVIRRS